MKIYLILAILNTTSLFAQKPQEVKVTQRNDSKVSILKKCIDQLNTGNWSNRNQASFCHNNYDIPSPFLIKCLQREFDNYKNLSPIAIKECHYYFRDKSQKAFKDHKDYNYNKHMPKHLQTIHNVLKRTLTIELD